MNEKLRIYLYKRCGLSEMPHIDQDYRTISEKIFKETNVVLSINTLKRIFAQWDECTTTKMSRHTEDTICKFLGYSSWMELVYDLEYLDVNTIQTDYDDIGDDSTIGAVDRNAIIVSSVMKGDTFWVKFGDFKIIQLEVLGNDRYRVKSVSGCKLEYNDVVKITSFMQGQQLVATNIHRGQKIYRGYHSGIRDVITKVTKSRKQLEQNPEE